MEFRYFQEGLRNFRGGGVVENFLWGGGGRGLRIFCGRG